MKQVSLLTSLFSTVIHLSLSISESDTLQAFHDDLDFISVHETLLQDFRTAIEGLRGRQSLENQIEHITKAKASPLIDQKALTNVAIFFG